MKKLIDKIKNNKRNIIAFCIGFFSVLIIGMLITTIISVNYELGRAKADRENNIKSTIDKVIVSDSDNNTIETNTQEVSCSTTGYEYKININTCSRSQLMSLDGIGEKISYRIIFSRPFNSVDDLLDIDGIGEVKLEKIRDKIKVE